jgi:Flp pilus assembly pilin Flp
MGILSTDETGASAIEYALLVALVAAVCAAFLGSLGEAVAALYAPVLAAAGLVAG